MVSDRAAGDFGSKLRAARERRGISLRHIANATKISIGALEALERNDISRLPGGIFSRAFVRSYASEVGLDPEETIRDFIAQFPHDSVTAGHPTSEQVEDNEALESDRRMASTFLRLVALSIPLAIVVVYFTTVGRRTKAPQPVEQTVAAASPTPAPPVEDPLVPAASTASPPSTPLTSSTGTTSSTTSTPATSSPASTSASADAAVRDRLTVAVVANRPCWLSATVDGQKAAERLFPAGQQQTFEVRKELVLTAGDATAISVTVNGAPLRPLGRAGQVTTTRINLSNSKDLLSAR